MISKNVHRLDRVELETAICEYCAKRGLISNDQAERSKVYRYGRVRVQIKPRGAIVTVYNSSKFPRGDMDTIELGEDKFWELDQATQA